MAPSVAECYGVRNSTPLPLIGKSDGYTFGMGTVREHREAWFKHLLRKMVQDHHGERGGGTAFAEKIKTSPSMVYQLASGNRGIGDTLARKIEAGFGLERGQIDSGPPEAVPEAPNFDAPLLHYLVEQTEAFLEETQSMIPPEKKGRVYVDMYGYYANTGDRPSRAVILQFIRRAA